jgi:hypothetical protein
MQQYNDEKAVRISTDPKKNIFRFWILLTCGHSRAGVKTTGRGHLTFQKNRVINNYLQIRGNLNGLKHHFQKIQKFCLIEILCHLAHRVS